jgi:hypothetical protein
VSHDGGSGTAADFRAIIDALRRHSSVHYPRTAVPGEFTLWRRRLRQVARLANVRISVTRGVDYFLVENLDYQVSEEDSFALTDVIEAHILGEDLSFHDAVQARRQRRLHLAPGLEAATAWGTASRRRVGSHSGSVEEAGGGRAVSAGTGQACGAATYFGCMPG